MCDECKTEPLLLILTLEDCYQIKLKNNSVKLYISR